MRNAISNLYCCLDSLERGHDRTVTSNLRMAFEDYCYAIAIHWNAEYYSLFMKEDLKVGQAISFAKKNRGNHKHFGELYGILSKITHHYDSTLLVRQILSMVGDVQYYAHLKPINPNKLFPQVFNLSLIAFLLLEVGAMAEEICIDLAEKPYFGIKILQEYQRSFDTSEDIFLIKLSCLLMPRNKPL